MESWLRFEVHDDGSIRGSTYRVGEMAIYPQRDPDTDEPILCVGMSPAERIGLEITTSPYPYSEWVTLSQKVAHYFMSIPQTPRTSIHVHVDMAGEPWTKVRDLLLWVYALEAPLFRMASGGMTHRGERSYAGEANDHRYARPLSDPIGVTWGRSLGPLIRWNDLKNAKTASEFVAAWGRMDYYWSGQVPLSNYCPHRLHMVNLVSLYRRGTFEWRLFDGMYTHLPLLIELVYRMHQLAEQGTPDFDPMLLGSEPGIDAAWMSELLGMDCEQLWGVRWATGCQVHNRRSHYNDAPILSAVTQANPVLPISNHRNRDSGADAAFPLFARRND